MLPWGRAAGYVPVPPSLVVTRMESQKGIERVSRGLVGAALMDSTRHPHLGGGESQGISRSLFWSLPPVLLSVLLTMFTLPQLKVAVEGRDAGELQTAAGRTGRVPALTLDLGSVSEGTVRGTSAESREINSRLTFRRRHVRQPQTDRLTDGRVGVAAGCARGAALGMMERFVNRGCHEETRAESKVVANVKLG